MRDSDKSLRTLSVWTVASYFLVPWALVSLVWKGLRYRPYFSRWPERFGFVKVKAHQPIVWIHAVSVGEVRSAQALVRAIQDRYPRFAVLITTMTPTGSEQVRKLFGHEVQHCYLPYDLPDVVARFLDRVQPRLAVIAETEFWPNLYSACAIRNIPLALVNVRVSANALNGYLRMSRTVRRMFMHADLVCAQTRTDAQRLRNLGVPEARLNVTGNLKFDVPVPIDIATRAEKLREQFGTQRMVWVAGSTHAGEETKILDAYHQLRKRWEGLLLVLVPREPERFAGVERLARRRGWNVATRTQLQDHSALDIDVLVGNTMGELQLFYAAGDLAFVGASLIRRGGHNILEAAAVGVPVLFGPHMFNFENIADMILGAGAGRQVYDASELAEAVETYLCSPALRIAAGNAAQTVIADNHGSLAKTLALLDTAWSARLAFANDRHRLEEPKPT